jgi:hypothetical protein
MFQLTHCAIALNLAERFHAANVGTGSLGVRSALMR